MKVIDIAAYREGKLVRVLPPPPYDWETQDPYLKREEPQCKSTP